jgi:hypothetical protein
MLGFFTFRRSLGGHLIQWFRINLLQEDMIFLKPSSIKQPKDSH